jgi:hypothetical protein
MTTATQSSLERQLAELMDTMNAERAAHKVATELAATRIRDLEQRLAATAPGRYSPTGLPVNGPTNGNRAVSPTAKPPGSPTAAKPRTVPSAQVGPATNGSLERAGSQDQLSAKGSFSRISRTASGANVKFSSKAAAASSTANTTASTKPAASEERRSAEDTTAAQFAWDKMCALVRNDLTVKELWLISLDTLRQLLLHYNVTDPVECAQIECQWALLQEGKNRVERPTPKRAPSPRAQPFQPAKQTGDFNLRTTETKPHLSKRTPLNGEVETRASNPNTSVIRGRSVSPGSKGAMHVDPIQGSNPNETYSPMRQLHGRKVFDSTATTLDRDERKIRGKARGHSPKPEPLKPFPQRDANEHEGVKRFSRVPSAEVTHRGLKVGYAKPSEKREVQSVRVKNSASGGGAVQWKMG